MAEASGKTAALRRDAILEAVAFAAERLLLALDWREAADDVLARLGITTDVSRAYIIENIGLNGIDRCWQRAEWCAPGVPSVSDRPSLNGLPWADSGFERWPEAMRCGDMILGAVDDLPPEEQSPLAASGVVSILCIPVFVGAEWWGLVGFDDCTEVRAWSHAEIDGLRAAAGVLGAAIHRRRSERQALEAESRYREVIDHIPAVSYTDLPGDAGAVVGFMSHQIEDLLGYPRERFHGDPDFWFSIIHPDDRDRIDAAARRAGSEDGRFDEEYRMLAADGREVWVHDISEPILDPDGAISYWQGFMTDVTERRRAEEHVRESEHRYRSLVDHAPDAILVHSEGRFVYANPAAADLLGAPDPAALVGLPILAIVHPDFRDAVLERVRGEAAGQIAPLMVERFIRLDGREIMVEVVGVPVSYDGQSAGQIVVRDVTERARADAQLREAEHRYRVLVENLPAVTYLEQPADAYESGIDLVYISPQVEDLLGYPPEAWVGRPDFWESIVHPDDKVRVADLVAESNRERGPASLEYRMLASDGRVIWIRDEAVLIHDEEGDPLYWQGFFVDITERKHAEEQLRAAEAKFRLLVEQMPAITYSEPHDSEGYDDPSSIITFVGPQIELLLGYTQDQWAEPGFWLRVIHPDDVEAVLEESRRSLATGEETYQQDYRMIAADGHVVWFSDQSVLVRDDLGDPIAWQGVMVDITRRKETEEQLRAAEERYRVLVEHIPGVVYVEAEDGETVLYLGPQIQAVFGYSVEDWLAEPEFWADRIHPDDRSHTIETDRRATQTFEPYAADYRFLAADGRWIWIHDEATFFRFPDGTGYWQGFLIDITERKRAEEELRTAEEQFRTIVEQSPAIIYAQEIDPDDPSVSRTTYISPRHTEVLGYGVEESLADPLLWTTMIHPDDRERVLAADAESNRDGEAFSLEYRMVAKDGRVVWMHDQAELVQVGGGRPFWQGFLLDVTERKRAEEQLERALEVEREATKRLRTLDEMKNTFLQAVSHDLRTPLAAILGLAVTLERGEVELDGSEGRDLAGRIAENARKLDRLVTNLLDLDRLGRGIVEPKLARADVGALVEHLLVESELVPSSRIQMDIESVVIDVDAAKVERIVENLIANTSRHTPAHARIWVSVTSRDGGALIAIEDDGPGVPAEIRETIFEPFLQGPDAPRHSPGVGVGLTLVRRFAELHGGRAWVEQRSGGGASFRVFLPDGRSHGPAPDTYGENGDRIGPGLPRP